MIWIGNKNGSFTVKSAYYVATKVVEQYEIGESTSDHSYPPFWKKIWQLKVPPKVKIFAWRTCMNDLPTMYNLCCKGLNSPWFFSLCDKNMESTSHTRLHYNHARQTWALWHDCLMDITTTEMDIIDIVGQLIEKGTL